MSSLVTTAAPVNYEEDNIEKKQISKKNHTYKNKDTSKKIDKEMLEQLYKSDNSDSDLDNMGDFVPVQKPLQNINIPEPTHTPPMQYNDNPIDETSYNNLQNTQGMDMYKQYIDNYNNHISPRPQMSNANSELLKKLDNILYLLEEQKEEQSHLITEELILYVFLGVFVIYVLDSFVRVGKYVR
tara:strand:+ start:495 stop:1046 length:552 start_codon:yes stop_codon:yes gene_type:complete